MFKEMRNKKQQLSTVESIEIINNGEYGVMGTVGENGYPYTVPVNYVYHNEKIYFHCATSGHKIEDIDYNAKVSFCVVGNNTIIPKKFDTEFKSVILFGKAREVFDKEKEEGLIAILQRFSSDHIPAGEKYIKAMWDKTKVFEIVVEHMSGKASE
ncbi:MAG: pyridoxamine 5'-phosphate oxidase family protein [Deltaproteobacteria bacterium]|jgi:uncharacterized protein|nr:pyridoxamine 5'-phosphate oxidase family protein [Deltaproteobacteria bacterium]